MIEKYNPPGLAIDLCLFTIRDKDEPNPKKIPEKELLVFLIKRENEPYKNKYSLTGCAAKANEKTETTLRRKIKEKVNLDIDDIYMEIGGVFDEPSRDIRNHVVSIAYMGLCNYENVKNINNGEWISYIDIKENYKDKIAFDHYEIIETMYKKLKEKIWKENIIFYTLPKLFTLYSLQLSYTAINCDENSGTDQNFRRKILAKDWIVKTDIKEENVVSRNKAYFYKLRNI